MKKKTYYEVVDENGKTIAIRKTDIGIQNWKIKHNVQKCGFNYTMNGKPIWIDYCTKYE